MADELDPRLEARLREALHAEADALPLLVREHDVLRERGRRRARRWVVPASLFGAAAVVAVLVATGVLGRGDSADVGATSSPSPSPSERPLASYEDLLAVIGPGASAALQGEGETPGDAGGPVETDLGLVEVTSSLKLAVSCLGGELTVVLRADGAELGSHLIHCSLQGPSASTVDPFAATPPAEARVVVIAPKGMRWRIAVADPFTDGPSPVIVRPSPGSGETPLIRFEVGAGNDVDTGAAVPAGTDEVWLIGRCAGEGELAVEIDGVRAAYSCGAIGVEVFVPDNSWLDIRASVTGSARFAIEVIARDLERSEAVTWRPPKLELWGPDATAGDIVTVTGFPGCGLSWEPRTGGGFVDDCGPSWQPIAGALHQRAGTYVVIELADGWTITAATAAIAPHATILPAGRSPAEQVLTIRREGDALVFDVPPAGDWGVKLMVSGEKNGDRFQVPFYARVLVEP